MTPRALNISKDLSLPEDAVTSTLLVYGGKGMGKTNFGAVLVEELSHSGLRWSVLDPMGVWFGIRHSIDGKGRGVECLILGGPHGDIPIEPTGGAIVADLVADENVNVVIDFSRKPNGESWGVGEKIRFVGDYGKQLFRRQGSLIDGRRREPLFQMIDEAARFMPQMIRAGEPQLAMCLSTWATIVEEGRNIGLGVGLLTQRSARLNKDVAELADIMLAFRTVGPNSITAVMDWLGEHVPKERIKNMIQELRALPVGSALVVSPGWLHIEVEKVIRIRARQTFDSSATPKPGERSRQVSGKGATPDLAKYAERMKDTIERIKTEDPRALKQRIADLEKQLSVKPATVASAPAPVSLKPDPAALDKIRAELLTDVSALMHGQGIIWSKKLRAIADYLTAEAVTAENPDSWNLEKIPAKQQKSLRDLQMVANSEDSRRPQAVSRVQMQNPHPSKAKDLPEAPRGVSGDSLPGPQQRLVNAIAWFESIGVQTPEQPAVAFLAGYSFTSSSFSVPKSWLNSRGLVEYVDRGNRIALTDSGRAFANVTNVPPTNEALHSAIMAKLGGPERRLLEPLLKAYPKSLDNDSLAGEAGYSVSSSSFSVPRSRLKTFGLIEYPQPGLARAKDLLFPQN